MEHYNKVKKLVILILKSENKQDQEYFESLVQKELTPSMLFKKVVYLERNH
jgi:hypothetical protein